VSCSRCHSIRHQTDSHDAIVRLYKKESVLLNGRWPNSIDVVDVMDHLGGKPRPGIKRRWNLAEGRIVVAYFFEEGVGADDEERVSAGTAAGERPAW